LLLLTHRNYTISVAESTLSRFGTMNILHSPPQKGIFR
jgi:hypothetical protein